MAGQNEKEVSSEHFYKQRREQIREAEANGFNWYPHKFHVKETFSEMVNEANQVENDSMTERVVQAAGRITATREHSKSNFYTVVYNDESIQLVLKKETPEKIKVADLMRRGDIVGFVGRCGRTRHGEPSVFCSEIVILAPCMRVIPSVKNLLTNAETIYRNRHLDLLVNSESKQRFKNRSRIINHIRKYFVAMDFMEVETPIMNSKVGGASAQPFITHHNELKMDLFMRVAPELFLKMLVVGGMERVFEIGKNFRNEGIDLTHNPEFTAIECYMAYADYRDLMAIVEGLLNELAILIRGSEKFTYSPAKRGTAEEIKVELDWSVPFKRLDILDELNRELGLEMDGESITRPEILEILIKKAESRGIELKEPKTLNRVLDAFIGEYIEPKCINPTFVTGFPVVMSPLAKDDRNRAGLTERFEMFVNGKELVNAYTELNIPDVQRERFEMQAKDAAAGDTEAMPVDEDFCQVLEYALPPTGGLGIGIDRLVMYLTDAANIRDVILYPSMKPEQN
ncbi:SYKC [Enterospora canceri]|uniref:Lysine--tRNA ligase n=1 Tax=Enterospora canceri TaxID=1081671 RepID=A0A1Y1S6V8_9MICR|nr:SYKC [Enterospora canceri]